MNEAYYARFCELREKGLGTEAREQLLCFISSFESEDEKSDWTRKFLELHSYGYKVHHELYTEVIFPVLFDGYERGEIWSLKWLARTSDNLLAFRSGWEKVGKGSYELLKDCYQACPRDPEIQRDLLAELIRGFHYCIHEWPSGILCGANATTVEDCDEILQDIQLAHKLDVEEKFLNFFSDVESKVKEYKERLQGS